VKHSIIPFSIYSSSRNTRDFSREIRTQSESCLQRKYNLIMKIQFSTASICTEFRSMYSDIFQTESLRILAERISPWNILTHHWNEQDINLSPAYKSEVFFLLR